jgi:hypothetical protein
MMEGRVVQMPDLSQVRDGAIQIRLSGNGETSMKWPIQTARESPAVQPDALTDTQVIRKLEQRRAGPRPGDAKEQRARAIPLLAPEDTATRRTLREAVQRDAPVWFAVQLQSSPQAEDLRPSAWDPIFGFYTLYATRARHGGREWFCLRLGFFSDVISAKQVALYLRSSYETAAVVPVGAGEKDGAAVVPVGAGEKDGAAVTA